MTIAEILYYTENRICHGVILKSSDKILSISDTTAAYIDKGNRNPLIGYKPQIARSKNGFVTSIIVPLDDGYSSAKGRKSAFEMGMDE